MIIDGRRFELTLASDLEADGMYLELDELRGADRITVASLFRSDADGSMSFSGYARDLPVRAIEWLLEEGRRKWPCRPDAI